MASFAYTAINAAGLESNGEINAADPAAAREALRLRGLLATTLSEQAAASAGMAMVVNKVKPKSLQIFSRQFATMIEAGLNVVTALVILEEQTEDKKLSALVAAGVDIIRALEITGTTAGNSLIEDATTNVRERVHQGVPIAVPLVENPVFPPMVSQMVRVGEETGELDKMLGKIADFYEDEVDSSINTLTSIIEPLMMIGVGIM